MISSYMDLIGWDWKDPNIIPHKEKGLMKTDGLNYFYLPNMFPDDIACAKAWTAMLKDKSYWVWGYIGHTTCEGKTPRAIVLSHEIGHLLGLTHINDEVNLMNTRYEDKGITKFIITDEQYDLINKIIKKFNLTFD